MNEISRSLVPVVILGLLASSVAASPPPVQVVACGQVVATATSAVLAADLDCTGASGIQLGARAKLALGGHALSGDSFTGIDCLGACTVSGPGSITGFNRGVAAARGAIKIDGGVDFAAKVFGVVGRRTVQVKDASFHDHLIAGVNGTQAVKIENSSFVDDSDAIESASQVKLVASTITGGARGIYARGASLIDSTIDTTTDGLNGADIDTSSRPRLKNSSCAGKSANSRVEMKTWGVCALD
jgi:hypothetical protein